MGKTLPKKTKHEAVVFDTETTGLVKNRTMRLEKQPEIIEFYGARVDLCDGRIIKEIDTFIKPFGSISQEITRINGIDDASVKDALAFAQHAKEIKSLIENAPVVIAHNAAFDKDMLDLEFERIREKLTWPRIICTIEATMHLKKYRLSLTKLHEHLFGEPFKGSHRAKADVAALIRCAVELHRLGEIQ